MYNMNLIIIIILLFNIICLPLCVVKYDVCVGMYVLVLYALDILRYELLKYEYTIPTITIMIFFLFHFFSSIFFSVWRIIDDYVVVI